MNKLLTENFYSLQDTLTDSNLAPHRGNQTKTADADRNFFFADDLLRLSLKGLGDCDLDDLEQAIVTEAVPLRIQTLPESSVTHWWPKFKTGLVDGTVFFDLKVASAGPTLRTGTIRIGDRLRVQAVECQISPETKKCTWRAFKLEPAAAAQSSIRQKYRLVDLTETSPGRLYF